MRGCRVVCRLLVAVSVVFGCQGLSWADDVDAGPAPDTLQTSKTTLSPESILPHSAVVYFRCDGFDAHQSAWKETAAYQAIVESGLSDAIRKMIMTAVEESGQSERIEKFEPILTHVARHGFSTVFSMPADPPLPIPRLVVVLHDAGQFEAALGSWIKLLARDLAFESTEIEGRTVSTAAIPRSGGMEFSYWIEGGHLVFAVGMGVSRTVISVAKGETPNITQNELWTKYQKTEPKFEQTQLGWIDIIALRKPFNEMPVKVSRKQEVPLEELIDVLGLSELKSIVCQSGVKGEAMWCKTTIENKSPRTRVMQFFDQPHFQLNDLPPLPANTHGFFACSIDWPVAYDTLIELVQELSIWQPEKTAEKIEGLITSLPAMLDFDLRGDMAEALGPVACVYNDPDQGLIGLGSGLVVQVRDARKVRGSIDKFLSLVEQNIPAEDFSITRLEKRGREIVQLNFRDSPGFHPSFSIDDEWLAIGLFSQSVETFFLRLDGEIDVWQPTAREKKALAELPEKFSSILLNDPRLLYRTVLGMAPIVMSGVEASMNKVEESFKKEFENIADEIDPDRSEEFDDQDKDDEFDEDDLKKEIRRYSLPTADLPPAALVVKPLFTNIAVGTADDKGLYWTSRSSLPGWTILGSVGGASPKVVRAVRPPRAPVVMTIAP